MSKLTSKGAVLALVAVAALLSWHTAAEPGTGAEKAAFPATLGEPAGVSAADNWPQFRGPGGLGIAEDAGVPRSWSETENIVWKAEIEGLGHSSPVIWGDTIFLTTALEGETIPGAGAPTHYIGGQVFKHPQAMGSDRRHTLKVMALDRASGEVLWSDVAYEGRVYDDRHRGASYASATAVTDGERVYFYFGSQGVYAYDFDGHQVWGTDLGDFSCFGVGLGTSPVLYGNVLILQIDDGEGAGSFIDAATGDVAYQGGRIPVPASMLMSSLLVVDGKIMLSTPEGDTFWIATGPEFSIAGHNSLDEPILTTPAIVGGMIYLRGRTHLYAIGSVDNEP